jgi:hypothetical protein
VNDRISVDLKDKYRNLARAEELARKKAVQARRAVTVPRPTVSIQLSACAYGQPYGDAANSPSSELG